MRERSYQSRQPTKLMFENRTMPIELSLSAVTVTVLGLCSLDHFWLKASLPLEGTKWLHNLLLSHESGICTQPMQRLSPALSSLNAKGFGVSVSSTRLPKPSSVSGKFSKMSHFWVEDAQPPSGQNTGKIIFTYISSPVRHIAFGNGSYTVETAINLGDLKDMTGIVT